MSRLTIFISLLLLTYLLEAAQAYRLEFKESGIYQVAPLDNQPISWLVTDGKNSYQPYYYGKHLLLYGQKGSVWQLVKSDKKSMASLCSDSLLIIKRPDVYKYSLPKATDSLRWFSGEVGAGEVLADSLNLNGYGTSGILTVKLFNFGETDSNGLRITVNRQIHKIKLTTHGELEYQTRYSGNADQKLIVQLDSTNQNIGVLLYQIQPDSTIITSQQPNGLYLATSNTVLDFKTNSAYYGIINGQFQPLQSAAQLPNWLYYAQQSEIETLTAEPVTELKKVSCDYLIVYANSFADKDVLTELKSLIRLVYPGLAVEWQSVSAIFDNLNHGQRSAAVLKEYLHTSGAKQVLLLGDANANEDDSTNAIPTFYRVQSYENTRYATDYPYCYGTDPFKPVIAISRLPLRSLEELQYYLYKYNRYLQDNKNGRLLIDDEKQISSQTDSVARIEIEAKLNLFDTGLAFTNIVNRHNPAVLHHLGHGSFSGWRQSKKIEFEPFENLHYGNSFLLFDQSCWTGDFAHPGEDSFAEKLLKLNGRGMVGGVVSTGFTPTDNSKLLYTELAKLAGDANPVQTLNEIKVKLFKEKNIPSEELYLYNWLGI